MKLSPQRHVLAILRLKLGMGQKEMATLLNCSRATVQAVELDKLKLSETLALRISLETGVDLRWLLDNDLLAPIPLSGDAKQLYRKQMNVLNPQIEYSLETFQFVQSHKKDDESAHPIWTELLRGLEDHARLRAIVESSRSKHLYKLARYKLDKFIHDMEMEFGFANEIVSLGDSIRGYDERAPDKVLEMVESEIASAKMYLKVARDDRDPKEIPAEEREDLATLMTLLRVVSPYEDVADPRVAKRVREARATEKATMQKIAGFFKRHGGKFSKTARAKARTVKAPQSPASPYPQHAGS